MKKFLFFSLFLFGLSSAVMAQNEWQRIASLPPGGNIMDLASDNNGTIYALSWLNTNIFYTTDNGLNWTEMPNTSELWVPTDIEVDKATGTLFVSSGWFGVEWTTDRGLTWHEEVFHPTPGGFYADITKCAFKTGTGTVVAAEFVDPFTPAPIHTTHNTGATWNAPVSAPFIAGYELKYLTDGTLLAGTENGIYYSSDDGASWSHATGLDTFLTILCLTQNTANGHVFAGVYWHSISTDTADCAFYRSTDNGHTWTSIGTDIGEHSIQAITYDSIHNKLYATSPDNVYVSADDGNTWTMVNTGLTTPEVRVLTANNSGVFLSSWRSGVAFSPDPVTTAWEYRNNNLGLMEMSNITVGHSSNDIHTLDIYNSDVYKLNSGNWTHQYTGLPNLDGQQIINDGNDVLYATYRNRNDQVYRSLDHGNTWTNIAAGLPAMAFGPFVVYTLAVDFNNNLYAIGNVDGFFSEIYRSTDSGNTWTTFLPTPDSFTIHKDIDFGHNAIYVTCVGFSQYFLESFDGGATWDTLQFPPTMDLYNGHLSVAPDDSLYILINDHIYRRTAIGNWSQLPDADWSHDYNNYPLSLFIDNNNHLYAASVKTGIFYCDNDSTWTDASAGLPVFTYPYMVGSAKLIPSDIKFSSDNTPYGMCFFRYSGAANQGIYKLGVPSGVKSLETEAKGLTVYPNPASGMVNVYWQGTAALTGQLMVYNMAGELVKVQAMAGNKASVNISDLPPGAYFIKASSGKAFRAARFIKE